jgi:hypothetical protein
MSRDLKEMSISYYDGCECMRRKWVAVPTMESLLIRGFHTLKVQDKLTVSQYIQEFKEGKLMVLSSQKEQRH